MIQVTWTGAAGLTFETPDEIILIDPYYTRVDLFNTLLGPISPDEAAIDSALSAMQKVKAVIVGHTHSDHALDVPYIIQRSNAQLVGSSSLDTLMTLAGLPGRTLVCRGGETVALSEHALVTMIRSAHGLVFAGKVPFQGEIRPSATLPMKASGYRLGTVFAPRLQIHGISFLHVGSANFIEEEVQGYTCDVLFLCAAGWHKTEGYPHRLIDITRPGTVVLIHYDDFSKPHVKGTQTRKLPLLDLKGMVRSIKAQFPQKDVVVPEIDARMSLG